MNNQTPRVLTKRDKIALAAGAVLLCMVMGIVLAVAMSSNQEPCPKGWTCEPDNSQPVAPCNGNGNC